MGQRPGQPNPNFQHGRRDMIESESDSDSDDSDSDEEQLKKHSQGGNPMNNMWKQQKPNQ